MIHGLSIDVEDYYQIIYRDFFQRETRPSPEVERNTNWFLDALSEAGVKATFFMLGNVARQFPLLVKRAVSEGHEIAVHGYDHCYIHAMKPEAFREELRRARDEIENIGGARAAGHRAPAFSIREGSLWAIDIVQELGFTYDSSIYPVETQRYGIKEASKTIYRWPNGLYEVPLSCLEFCGKAVPVVGGGYIRHFPYWWTRYAIRRLERLNRPAVVYMHPYEFEESYPRLDVAQHTLPRTLRMHTVLQARNRGKKQRAKLKALLGDFSFAPLQELVAQHTP